MNKKNPDTAISGFTESNHIKNECKESNIKDEMVYLYYITFSLNCQLERMI